MYVRSGGGILTGNLVQWSVGSGSAIRRGLHEGESNRVKTLWQHASTYVGTLLLSQLDAGNKLGCRVAWLIYCCMSE